MTNVLPLEVVILMVLPACGCQPQNNWTVHVWRRQWCQFEYLIKCGASLWKDDRGLLNFFICLTLWRKCSPRECKCQKHFIVGSCWIQIGIQFINQFSKLSCRGDYIIPDLSKSNSPVCQYVGMIHEEIIRHWCTGGNSWGHPIHFSQY